MSAARRIVDGHHYNTDAKWKRGCRQFHKWPDVHRATLSITGLGRIGQAVFKRAKGYGHARDSSQRTSLIPK